MKRLSPSMNFCSINRIADIEDEQLDQVREAVGMADRNNACPGTNEYHSQAFLANCQPSSIVFLNRTYCHHLSRRLACTGNHNYREFTALRNSHARSLISNSLNPICFHLQQLPAPSTPRLRPTNNCFLPEVMNLMPVYLVIKP